VLGVQAFIPETIKLGSQHQVRQDRRAGSSFYAMTPPTYRGIAAEGAMESWITFGGSSETSTTCYAGTGVGANAEDRVPILIARRQTTATAYAWAVALTGAAAAPVVTPVRVTAADDTALWPGSAAAARITHAGKTYLGYDCRWSFSRPEQLGHPESRAAGYIHSRAARWPVAS
jgi:hypothetical protein